MLAPSFWRRGGQAESLLLHQKVDSAWVRAVAEQGVQMFVQKQSVPEYVAAHATMSRDVIAEFEDRFDGKPDDQADRH
jgi:hypothetical protein